MRLALVFAVLLSGWMPPQPAWAQSQETGASACRFPELARQGRPLAGEGATKVSVRLYLVDVPLIEDVEQSFVADVFVGLRWQDPRLVHPGPEPCTLALAQVWNPQLWILNRRQADGQLDERVEVSADGLVNYRQRIYGTFSAPMDLRRFPFDSQTLGLRLISPHSPAEVLLVSDRSLFSRADDLSLTNWRAGQPQAVSGEYEVVPGVSVTELKVTLPVQRRSAYYLWTMIAPMCIVVFMSWAVFWLSPQHIAPRVGLAATSMLTLIALRLALGRTLPPIPYLTQLDLLTIGVTIVVFAALVHAVVSTALWDRGHEAGALAMNRWARVAFPLAFLGVGALALTY